MAFLLCIAGVSAYTTSDSTAAAGNVYISNVTYDPGAFFTGDSGTVTISVTNGNRNQSVAIEHALFSDSNFRLTSGEYDTTSNIGPLQTRTYVFSLVTDAPEGAYYPRFSLGFRDAGSVYYPALVWVDNSPLVLTVQDKPDAFTVGTKSNISLQVANPRKAGVKNVILNISGQDADIIPSTQYIGSLENGASVPVNFYVTPYRETTLNITLSYDNGDNHHAVTLPFPVVFSPDKTDADPVMSNVVITNVGGVYHVTGDVTNAGLSTANAVTVTALSPAKPCDPYRSYVIGALKPDDFGSFEVTFSAQNQTRVPIQMSYKDSDGNIISSKEMVNLPVFAARAAESGSSSVLPLVVVILAIVAFVAYWVLYLRKYRE
ncbi:MAG: hypothetical protein LUQ31_05920 [Methanoregula sp.]|nr:hypothetical protein [Methanoregula sp.]